MNDRGREARSCGLFCPLQSGGSRMEKTNWFLELYPTTKLFVTLFMVVSAFLVEGYWYAYLMLPVCLMIAYFTQTWKELWNLVMKGLLPICLFIFLFQIFFHPGETVLWTWHTLSITQEGIDFSLFLTSRIVAVGSAIILFFRVTPVKDFVYALEKLGLSPKATYVVLATFNIIPEMHKLSLAIMDAQKTRGVETEGNLLVRAKAFLPTLAPLILTSIAHTEERAITLEARAFTVPVKKTSLYQLEKTKKDTGIRALILILLIIIVVWRFVL